MALQLPDMKVSNTAVHSKGEESLNITIWPSVW